MNEEKKGCVFMCKRVFICVKAAFGHAKICVRAGGTLSQNDSDSFVAILK